MGHDEILFILFIILVIVVLGLVCPRQWMRFLSSRRKERPTITTRCEGSAVTMKKTVTGTAINITGPRQNPKNRESELTIEIKGCEDYSHLHGKTVEITFNEITPGQRLNDVLEAEGIMGAWTAYGQTSRGKLERAAAQLVKEGWAID